MKFSESIKQKSLFKIILISFLSLFTLMVLFFAILFILFLAYKDDISKTLLTSVNQEISGEITFSDLSFSPFRHFPNASIVVENFCLKESKDSIENINKLPVFDIDQAYISLNIVGLFSSEVSASEITFEGGSINVIVYPDSQTNLEKAIKKVSEEDITAKKKPIEADTAESKKTFVEKTKSDLSILINNLELTNILVTAENQFKKNKLQLTINELISDFSYSKKQIATSIYLNSNIDSLIKSDELLLSDRKIKLESKIEIDTDSVFAKLEEGSFSIGDAEFFFKGVFDSKNDGYVDISISGSDENFSLLTLLLRDEGIKNLKSGKVYFNGSVKGRTVIEFPAIEILFGMTDVYLINPITKREINKLNLKAYFNSGKTEDWSSAKLRIDTLYADFPDGSIKASGSVRNFNLPEIDVSVFITADITGLENILNLGSVSDLKGKIQLNDRIKGKYDLTENKFVSEINSGNLLIEDFGLKIPDTIALDEVNGTIRRENDDVYFEDLSVISEDTDFLINGKVNNLPYLLFNIEKEITADLDIKSSIFDLPNFLLFDPTIKRDFNYRILDVDMSVMAKTTTSKVTKFKSFPEIEFDIQKIYATVEDFLPRLEINSGIFKISEDILGFNLKFRDFKTDFLNGKFNFDAEYNTSNFQPYYIKAKTGFSEVYLSKLFYTEKDTVPELMQGRLSGNFFVELQFPTDSTVLKFLKLKDANLTYEFSKDTIIATDLNLDFNEIYFNEVVSPNLLATTYFNGNVKAGSFSSNSFYSKDFDFEFDANNGSYQIKSELVRLFGEDAKGRTELTFAPFDEFPSYQLSLTDVQFQSENMLRTFMEDTVITGPLYLSLNLNSTGSEWNSIVSNMNGTIDLSGKKLMLNGVDADEIIEKYKRSQNFNLVDLGAVVLAGPVGLAVTKGTDFASILVLNSGKSTNINQLVSNWTVDNGIFKISDAAFATNKNRIAMTGSIGFSNQNLDLIIALLNPAGCSIFSQQIQGNLNSPTMGKVKVVGTVLAPLANLVDDMLGIECDVFYDGVVKHPKIEK